MIFQITSKDGRLDKEKLSKLIINKNDTDFFICGPKPLINGIKDNLLELNVKKNKIHYEY